MFSHFDDDLKRFKGDGRRVTRKFGYTREVGRELWEALGFAAETFEAGAVDGRDGI